VQIDGHRRMSKILKEQLILFVLEFWRVYLTALGTHRYIEDLRATCMGFRPDPYMGAVFAGLDTGKREGTCRCTCVHPYEQQRVGQEQGI
jgi:hypothetical protein